MSRIVVRFAHWKVFSASSAYPAFSALSQLKRRARPGTPSTAEKMFKFSHHSPSRHVT